MASRSTLALLGYYGFGNLGDEALLAGIITGLRRVAPAVSPLVLTANPSGTGAQLEVETANRSSLAGVWGALSRADALMCGGGSLLQNVTSNRSLYYYLGVISLAQMRAVPTCLFGQGVGPLAGSVARFCTSMVLRKSRGVWVRDRESFVELERLRVGKRLRMAADPAFLLPAVPKAEGQRLLAEKGVKHGCWVVAVRPWRGQEQWLPALGAALGAAALRAGVTLVFLPFHAKLDQEVAVELAAQVAALGVAGRVIVPDSYQEAQTYLAGADLVIAMRLHALILAASAGVASVALSYDPKVEAGAKRLQVPWVPVASLGEDNNEYLEAIFAQAWRSRGVIGSSLEKVADKLRGQVTQSLGEAVEAVGLGEAGRER